MTEPFHPIVLYDGRCGLCRCSVRFILRRDPAGIFRFAPLNTAISNQLMEARGLNPQTTNSVVLIEQTAAFTHSTAVLRIFRQLHGPVRLLGILRIVPRPLRDLGYTLVAVTRTRLSRFLPRCPFPPGSQERFLS